MSKCILRVEFMKKILVIGAGHGGMQAAKVLAAGGFDVTVYEKSDIDHLSRDRWDTIETAVFDELDIPVPEGTFKDGCCSFVAPDSDKELVLDLPEEKRDWTADRRVLAKQLANAAMDAGAKFIFGKTVDKLVFDNTGVRGIVVDGEEIRGDLVIDASGVFSPFRASLPDRFGITKQPDKNDVFYTWDAFMTSNSDVPYPDYYGFLMHLKYKGEKCVAWCVEEFDDKCAAFIGKAGGMNKEEFDRLYAELKKDYTFMGDEILRGGEFQNIPIRFPLSKMVADGYAAVGDSAFMTIPLIGCGVANSLRAGQILGEKIVEANDVSVDTLWKYQVEYYQKTGAACCLIDCVKRFLLNADNDDLKFFFESDIVSNEELSNILNGRISLISVAKFIDKIKNAYKVRGLLGGLVKAAVNGVNAMRIAVSIPKEYNPLKVRQWQTKLEDAMK